MKNWITTDEAAAIAGVSRQIIQKRIRDGQYRARRKSSHPRAEWQIDKAHMESAMLHDYPWSDSPQYRAQLLEALNGRR